MYFSMGKCVQQKSKVIDWLANKSKMSFGTKVKRKYLAVIIIVCMDSLGIFILIFDLKNFVVVQIKRTMIVWPNKT